MTPKRLPSLGPDNHFALLHNQVEKESLGLDWPLVSLPPCDCKEWPYNNQIQSFVLILQCHRKVFSGPKDDKE